MPQHLIVQTQRPDLRRRLEGAHQLEAEVAVEQRLPGQTSNPAICAAGDMTRGSDLVVTAIADAREALGETDCAREIRERWQTYRG